MALPDEERDELRTTVRSLLAREAPMARVRATVAEPPGWDRALWEQMVELGWTSIHVAEEHGGAGCGFVDLAVVLHELGRAVTPSPFLASAVLTTTALSMADERGIADELLAGLVRGDSIGALGFASTAGTYDLDRLTTTWGSDGSDLRLAGAAGFVLDADLADVLVVAASDGDGTIAALVVEPGAAGVRIERAPTIDETRRVFTVSFDDVSVAADRLLCEPGPRARELLDQVLAVGVVAAACDTVGAAERAMEGAADYAKERVQFGKPIGTFQAVKHQCADMAIAVEAGRAATRAAAEAFDADSAGWATTAAITSSYVGPAATQVCARALRVHGGIGFTSEHDSHLFLKRVKLDEVLFGTPSWHRRRLADVVFPPLVAS